MASCLNVFGRIFFFVALIAQTAMFAQYPSIYLDNGLYNLLVFLIVPTLIAWIVILNYDNQLEKLWMVWIVYVVTLLIPMICWIFVGLKAKLDSNEFFGPNILIMITCGAPAIALLLLMTAKDAPEENNALFTQLCGSIVLDLFDDIEILDILLSQNECFHISAKDQSLHLPWPRELENSIIAFVCIGLLLSTLEMAEWKSDGDDGSKNRRITFICRLILSVLFVNFPLLVIRLVVWLKYKYSASIFIAKNLIIIAMSIINLVMICCGRC